MRGKLPKDKEKTLKKIIATFTSIALAGTLGIGLAGCAGTGSSAKSDTTSQSSTEQSASATDASESYISTTEEGDEYATGTHHIKIAVKGYSPINVTLDADTAPVTVSQFCKLANEGFYNGLTFHRVVDEFCLQGGDPNGNGTGGSGQPILGEFSANGVANKLADDFKRGTIAMARATDNNSAEGQFFITLSSTYASSLNGNYAAFGTVDKAGMKVVDKIVEDSLKYADESQSGTITKTAKQPKITSIKVID